MTVEEVFIIEDVPIEVVMKKIEAVETHYTGLLDDKFDSLMQREGGAEDEDQLDQRSDERDDEDSDIDSQQSEEDHESGLAPDRRQNKHHKKLHKKKQKSFFDKFEFFSSHTWDF